jgi:glycosyltransferase involved in cell wall biosynthesis
VSGLRFCFLTTFYPPYNFGGDGIAIQRLARGLVSAGHSVSVLHDVDAYAALGGRAARDVPAEPKGLDVIPLRSGIGPLSLFLTQQLGRPVMNGRRISRFLSEGQFDVINFHNISLIGGPGLLKYGDALKLYMAHEHWLVCPTHVLWRHRRELCTGRQCGRCQLAYRRPPQLWRYTKYLERQLAHVHAFIALSEFSRTKHREFGFPREMEVLPSFLPDNAENNDDAEGPRPHSRPYFLFVGRLERIKGVQDVLPAFRGDGETDFLIAGDGGYRAELHAQAAGMARVRFLGKIPSDDLARYYRHAVAVIVPSVCFETFGIILLEAFKHSTPVIARRLGPFPEILTEAGGGELFETLEELVASMDHVYSDPSYRDRLSRAGHQAFRTRWSDRVVVPRYLEIVRSAAEQQGRTRLASLLSPRRDTPPPDGAIVERQPCAQS